MMTMKRCFRSIPGWLICAMLLASAWPCQAAEQKVYGYHAGSAAALVEAAEAYLVKEIPDLRRETEIMEGGEGQERASISYEVTRNVKDWLNPPDGMKLEDVTVVQVAVVAHRPRADETTATALKHGKESFDFFVQDDVGHGEPLLEQALPEATAPPGTYGYYLTKTRLQAIAGNLEITIRVPPWVDYQYDTYKIPRVDRKAVLAAILAGLSGEKATIPGKVEVFPAEKLTPTNVGLIPASEKLPAKIVFSGAHPGDEVRFALAEGATGELRGPVAAGRSVTVRADGDGKAVAQYFYQSAGFPLPKPLTVGVQVSCAGQTLPAEIKVGLGLTFDKLTSVQGQTYANDTHAFSMTVRSVFHPELNVALYLANAKEAQVWPWLHVGLKMIATWVNRPNDAPHDEAYLGTVDIVAGEAGSYLVANQTPWYGPPGGKFFYPAVVMKSPGKHTYRINGRGAVLDTVGNFVAYLDEKMQSNDTLLVLSKDDPESWYQSLACSLNATSDAQYLMLEAVKLVPVYGSIADQATTVSGLVCGLLNAEYEKSLLDVANWLGAQYLDNLMEPAVFNKLSARQQDAVLAAKGITTGGTDNLKRAQDVEGLRNPE